MYVNLQRDEDDEASDYLDTYAFTVYTIRYLQEQVFPQQEALMERNVLIVPTIADDWMLAYLKQNAEAIRELGDPR